MNNDKLQTTHTGLTSDTTVNSTSYSVSYSSSNSTLNHAINIAAPDYQTSTTQRKVVDAVYGYIQAVRALDRTNVTVPEISSALSIPRPEVISALRDLKEKGVKFKT
jgi:hypothetical protein